MNNIKIQFVQVITSKNLENYILKKLSKTSKLYQKLIDVEVYIKYENNSNKKGEICEIKLKQPSVYLLASSNENNYQLAVKKTVENIKRQLEKYKNE